MPQRLRVKNLQDNADFLADLNICADDPRLYAWINSFESQALQYGRWWGTTQLVQFCLTDSGCLILPREIATIEAANIGGRHAQVRNGWYEFVKPHELCESNCCSSRSCGCGCGLVNVQDHGTVASFATTTGTNKKIRVYPGNASDVGKTIIFQGKDSNGVWVRSTIDGSRQDGEEVTLALPFVDTVTVWGPGAPFAVMKDQTNYRVLVYSVDQTTGDEVALAEYEPTETEPAYRRVNLSGYRGSASVDSSVGRCATSSCNQRTLSAIVSLDKIPVQVPNDWLLFPLEEVYRYGIQSIKARKDNNYALADAFMFGNPMPAKALRGPLRYAEGMGAIPLLRALTRKMTSDTTSINMMTDSVNLASFR